MTVLSLGIVIAIAASVYMAIAYFDRDGAVQ